MGWRGRRLVYHGEIPVSGLTIPVIPSLPAGHVVQLSELQALASAASFLLGKPATEIADEVGGQAITTSYNPVTFSQAIFDVDGMWNVSFPSRLTIQTPGWFKLRYIVNTGTVANALNTYVTSTSGSNNPGGAGVTSAPYWAGYCENPGGAGLYTYAGASGVWPFFLYAGDYLQVSVTSGAAGSSTATGAPGTATEGFSRFSLEYVST